MSFYSEGVKSFLRSNWPREGNIPISAAVAAGWKVGRNDGGYVILTKAGMEVSLSSRSGTFAVSYSVGVSSVAAEFRRYVSVGGYLDHIQVLAEDICGGEYPLQVEVSLPEEAVELPLPPFAIAVGDCECAMEAQTCFRSEVADIVGPFIRQLQELPGMPKAK
ncbi:MAG: hypothetical protein WC518_03650 [Patescibacteria group bacterium]